MARKAPSRAPVRAPSVPATRLVWVVLKGALTLGLMLALVGALIWLGSSAGQQVSQQGRYTASFSSIQVEPPPGRTAEQFLTEVRTLSNLPETIQTVDQNLVSQLSAAFSRHPMVAAVLSVSVEPTGKVTASLRYRKPALVIQVAGHGYRVLDSTGVLLPLGTNPESASGYGNEVKFEAVEPGQPWPDSTIRRAAELANAYSPKVLQRTIGGWKLAMQDGKILHVHW
jgi:hypothetical protein